MEIFSVRCGLLFFWIHFIGGLSSDSGSLMPPTGFKLTTESDGFYVDVGHLTILTHKHTDPMLKIGNGQDTYLLPRFETYIEGNDVVVLLNDEKGHQVEVHFFTTETCKLVACFKHLPEGFHSLWIKVQGYEDEALYGGGAQYKSLNHKGHRFPIWLGQIESSLTSTWKNGVKETLFPQATFLSSKKYFVHIQGSSYTEFDFTQPLHHEVFVRAKKRQILLHFNTASSMLEAHRKLTYVLIRRQQDPPLWVHDGITVIARDIRHAKDVIEKAKKKHINIAAVLLRDHSIWTPYDDIGTSDLKAPGIHLLGSVSTCIPSDYHNLTHPTIGRRSENSGCANLDLTNTDAFNWFKDMVYEQLIKKKFSGWHLEVPSTKLSAAFDNGDAAELRNQYPALALSATWEATGGIEMVDQVNEFLISTNCGGESISKYPALALIRDGSDLTETVRAMLSMGISGLGFSHLIIDKKESESVDMVMRKAELSLFSGAFRIDGELLEVLSDEDIAMISLYAQMRQLLANYTQEALTAFRRSGFPLQRPLFLHYDYDPHTFTVEDEFLYGRDILVAPVTDPGVRSRKIYLPQDQWIYLYDNTETPGPILTDIAAPLGRMPVFYRKSSPWFAVLQKLSNLFEDSDNIQIGNAWKMNIATSCQHCDEL